MFDQNMMGIIGLLARRKSSSADHWARCIICRSRARTPMPVNRCYFGTFSNSIGRIGGCPVAPASFSCRLGGSVTAY